MEFKNICTKQVFADKNGTQKTRWFVCGTLKILDDGRMFMTMNHLPNVDFYVFDQKKEREAENKQKLEQGDIDWDE